ncbi:hypothetical protein quinque_008317 [Culex quinquefasciatus]|uniref:ankyrin repeat, SAM and basic leucine zipper domain-containing protein 1 n=1 Tax=Culex quinquefasciatus TaxID=7176 RepID=UPI0018E33148|nr:ankyrin repeat, SAM and basic leucine zipper domain-containing protein 1 [Culex quinquefasciatus]
MFRPAGYSDSDSYSDSEYDFCYGRDKSERKPAPNTHWLAQPAREDHHDALYRAILEGNLPEVRRLLELDRTLELACLRTGWPSLLVASSEARPEIVSYLLEVRGIDVNETWDLKTALMVACDSMADEERVLETVKLLLEFGAVINCKDRQGKTPLMFAATRGHTEVVRLLVDQASLEATDNDGLTALFHGVNSKNVEIVEMLLKAGSATDIINRRGFTPRQEAEFEGYADIVALFPVENHFNIPFKYMSYARYQDITQGESEVDRPGYYPEIGLLLYGMYSEQHLERFAKENIDLTRFLTLDDDQLKELGFTLPFERKKILYGLLKFHRRAWSKRSMCKFSKDRQLDSFDLLETVCAHLKQVTVMQASLVFVAKMMPPAEIKNKLTPQIRDCLRKATELRQAVDEFSEEIKRIHELTAPRPVMHIDGKREAQLKGRWLVKMVKFSLLSGVVSFMVYRRLKN